MNQSFNKSIRFIISVLLIPSILFASVIFVWHFVSVANAAFNQQINYQGKLANSSSSTVPNGKYSIRFKLYTVPTGGSAIWTETWCNTSNCAGSGTGPDARITLTSGLFSAMLGSTTPLTGIDFNQTLYLGVEIGGLNAAASWDGEMSPRKILGAVPAAFIAGTSSIALSANTLSGIASSSFLRSDIQNATSSSSTFLNVLQSGAGKIAEFFSSAANSALAILSGGNVGVGSSTPSAKLAVHDASGLPGTNPLFMIASSSPTGTGTTTLFTILGNGNISSAGSLTAAGAIYSTNTNATSTFSGGFTAGNNAGFTVNRLAAANSLLVAGNSNIGIGSTTPYATLSVVGSMALTGALYDASTSAGALGNILQSDGNSTHWVSTTSLGFASSAQIGAGTQGQVPYYAAAGSTLTATSSLFIAQSGNVGIGTVAPGSKFVVNGDVGIGGDSYYSHKLAVYGNTVTTDLLLNATTGGDETRLYNAGGSAATSTAFGIKNSSGINLLNVLYGGNVGIGTTTPAARLSVVGADLLISNLAMSVGGSNGPGMVVTNGGTVGIGTTGPGAKLDVTGSSGIIGRFAQTGTWTGSEYALSVSGYSNIGGFRINGADGVRALYLSAGQLGFAVGDTSPITFTQSDSTERMRISSTGNVGIGTTTPSNKLEVAGNAYFAGTITATSTATSSFAGPIKASCFSTDGITCISGTALSGGVANSLTYWTGAGTLGATSSPVVGYIVANLTTATSTFLGGFTAGNSAGFTVNRLSPVNSLFVAGNGNVGVGTAIPVSKLDVNGDLTIGNILSFGHLTGTPTITTSSTDARLEFITDRLTTTGVAFNFRDAANNSSLAILDGGNVGIGTVAPATILDIGGGTDYTNSNATYQYFSSTAKKVQIYDASQSVLNLVSGINTDGGVLGAVTFSRSLGQSDAHRQLAGIRGVQEGTGTTAGGDDETSMHAMDLKMLAMLFSAKCT